MGMEMHKLSWFAVCLALVVAGPSAPGQEATAASHSALEGASSAREQSAPTATSGKDASAPAAAGRPSDESTPGGIPQVLLTTGHRALCRVKVGDRLPPIQLPRLGSETTDLATLAGKRATVVLFWQPDRWMARTALGDLSALTGGQDTGLISIVGVAVGQPAGEVQSQLADVGITFPQLCDTEGSAFAQIGSATLPRIYVLDHLGKIVWFDIEYSQSTHRELLQTIKALTTDSTAGGP